MTMMERRQATTHTPIAVPVEDLDLILSAIDEMVRAGEPTLTREAKEAIGRIRGRFPAEYPATSPVPIETWMPQALTAVVKNGFQHAVRNGDDVGAAYEAIRNLANAGMLIAPQPAQRAS